MNRRAIERMIDSNSFQPIFDEVAEFCEFTPGIIYDCAGDEEVTKENAQEWVRDYLIEGLNYKLYQETFEKAKSLKEQVLKEYN
jgi:hypothetical protein